MHASVMSWLQDQVSKIDQRGLSVLEVGSLNVNGSARELFDCRYHGIDIQAGDGVDEVLDICEAGEKYQNLFDIVVCTEMLEHAENWREAIDAMKDVLKNDGLLLLTTRSPDFGRHEYPGDYWRFRFSDMEKIFLDMETEIKIDHEHPGVFVLARKTDRERVDLSEITVSEI